MNYVDESDRILLDNTVSGLNGLGLPLSQLTGLEPAGARRRLFFDPSKTRAGIVTCGGLCPGLNNVIRSLVMEMTRLYGVPRVYGFCSGYQGFIPSFKRPVLELTPVTVSEINEHGGTMLGSSRGEQSAEEIVDCLDRMGINILFVDETLRRTRQANDERGAFADGALDADASTMSVDDFFARGESKPGATFARFIGAIFGGKESVKDMWQLVPRDTAPGVSNTENNFF